MPYESARAAFSLPVAQTVAPFLCMHQCVYLLLPLFFQKICFKRSKLKKILTEETYSIRVYFTGTFRKRKHSHDNAFLKNSNAFILARLKSTIGSKYFMGLNPGIHLVIYLFSESNLCACVNGLKILK